MHWDRAICSPPTQPAKCLKSRPDLVQTSDLIMANSFPSLSQGSRAFPLPSIPEDTLHYTLHLPSTAEQDESSLAVLISDYVQSLLIQPWLWNKDAWELKPAEGVRGKLEGRMRVGDAVDDEWLVVWLLREVSRRWKELVIRYVRLSCAKAIIQGFG